MLVQPRVSWIVHCTNVTRKPFKLNGQFTEIHRVKTILYMDFVICHTDCKHCVAAMC